MKFMVNLPTLNTKLGCLMIHNQVSTTHHQAYCKVHSSNPQLFNNKVILEEISLLQAILNIPNSLR